jgi:HAMP domain-containing protein
MTDAKPTTATELLHREVAGAQKSKQMCDLVVRLRAYAGAMSEAADEIERLQKEVRRMKRELSKIETDADYARFKLAMTVFNEQKER